MLRITAAGFLAILWLAGISDAGQKAGKEGATCGEYGTTVHFEKTPSDAARKALKEEKLVCILHVSGDFENPDFT